MSAKELTARHKEIIEMCQQGLKLATVARRLGISIHTVKAHKHVIYNRLNVKTNDDAWLKIKEMESSGR
jgi:DNA-binding NarL/FixJ family response regulator